MEDNFPKKLLAKWRRIPAFQRSNFIAWTGFRIRGNPNPNRKPTIVKKRNGSMISGNGTGPQAEMAMFRTDSIQLYVWNVVKTKWLLCYIVQINERVRSDINHLELLF